MPVQYHVYANAGRGDPVNYASPVATTAALSFTPPALAAPSDNTFAVRAFDAVTGLEEANTSAVVRVVIDLNGSDITAAPNAPHALTASAEAGGACRVAWGYRTAGQGGAPAGFNVYLTPGSSLSYAAPAATVTYNPGQSGYETTLTGLADGQTYAVGVRAFNATAPESNTNVTAAVVGDSTPPANVDALTVAPTFSM